MKMFVIVMFLMAIGCTSTPEPLETIVESLKQAPDYTIILEDMKEEGFFFTDYFHKYKIVQDGKEKVTDFMEVSERFYRKYQNFLGMAIFSKADNVVDKTPAPPGYSYIGNSNYGQWRQDNAGNSFWEFYGKYAMFNSALDALSGVGRNRFYRSDYEEYRYYKDKKIPYYGSRNEFGTNGSYTQKTNPSFFARKKALMETKKSSFSSKVNSTMGRSRSSSSRSSSSSSGK
jgi:hypothetical protein